MIRVRVLFLARLREATGMRELSLSLTTGSLAALREALAGTLPTDAVTRLFAENVRVAVNRTVWNGAVQLSEGDEVAFLPPVTGG